jgi:hypothetical protein
VSSCCLCVFSRSSNAASTFCRCITERSASARSSVVTGEATSFSQRRSRSSECRLASRLIEPGHPISRIARTLVGYWLNAFFIPEDRKALLPGGPVVPVVLQAILQTFGGTERWDWWDHHERFSICAAAFRFGPTCPTCQYRLLSPDSVEYQRYHPSHRRNCPVE